MHATRQDPDSDSDTEDIVVYADEEIKKRRIAQVFHLNLWDIRPGCLGIVHDI